MLLLKLQRPAFLARVLGLGAVKINVDIICLDMLWYLHGQKYFSSKKFTLPNNRPLPKVMIKVTFGANFYSLIPCPFMKFLLHDKRAWNMECKMIMSYLVSNKICIHTYSIASRGLKWLLCCYIDTTSLPLFRGDGWGDVKCCQMQN